MLQDIKDDNGKVLFSIKELQCKKSKDGILACSFAEKLKELRLLYGHPMIVNSCCRSLSYNQEIGGVKNSFHIFDEKQNLATCAIDIAKQNGILNAKLIRCALNLGFSVGIAKTFIHLDLRSNYTNLPQTLFLY